MSTEPAPRANENLRGAILGFESGSAYRESVRRVFVPRIFVAIPVAAPVREALGRLRRHPAPQLRWVAERQYHITLQFLGHIAEEDVAAVRAACEAAVAEAMPEKFAAGGTSGGLHLVARGIGAFPHRARARVVWIGIGGDVSALRRLQAELAQRLVPLVGPGEGKPFSPHITVARSRRPVPLPQALAAYADVEFGRWRADTVQVVESELTPAGPIYTVRHSVPLTSGNTPADTPTSDAF